MSALAGFIIGYVVGVKQGPQSYEKLLAAWETISNSPEVKGILDKLPTLGDLMTSSAADGIMSQIKGVFAPAAAGEPGENQRPYARLAGLEQLLAGGMAMAGNLLERGMTMVRERGDSNAR